MKPMTWVISELREITSWETALHTIPLQIEALEIELKSIRAATIDSQAVSGGGGNRREEAIIANIYERDKLKANYKTIKLRLEAHRQAMEKLSKEEAQVLEKSYIHPAKNPVEELIKELGYERTSVYRIRDEALIEYARAKKGIQDL